MQVHPSLPADVLYRWSIDPARRVEPFRKEQRPFLARHRELFAQKWVEHRISRASPPQNTTTAQSASSVLWRFSP